MHIILIHEHNAHAVRNEYTKYVYLFSVLGSVLRKLIFFFEQFVRSP